MWKADTQGTIGPWQRTGARFRSVGNVPKNRVGHAHSESETASTWMTVHVSLPPKATSWSSDQPPAPTGGVMHDMEFWKAQCEMRTDTILAMNKANREMEEQIDKMLMDIAELRKDQERLDIKARLLDWLIESKGHMTQAHMNNRDHEFRLSWWGRGGPSLLDALKADKDFLEWRQLPAPPEE